MFAKASLCLVASLILLSNATQLTLIVEQSHQKADDVIEIEVGVEAEAQLIKDALQIASARVEEVNHAIQKHCRKTRSRKQCDDIAEQGGCEMEPLYKAVKGEPVFQEFAVYCMVGAEVKDPSRVGTLADELTAMPGVEVTNIEWPLSEEADANREAVEKGLAQAVKRCKHLGMAFSKVLSIEEIVDLEVEEEEEEADDENAEDNEIEEDEEEDEEEYVTFKVVVQCEKAQKADKVKKSKKTK